MRDFGDKPKSRRRERRPPATLRTKTGCANCRARRRKCDEQHPTCIACAKRNIECSWPFPDPPRTVHQRAVLDKASTHVSPKRARTLFSKPPVQQQTSKPPAPCLRNTITLSYQLPEGPGYDQDLLNHYASKLSCLLINRDAHPQFQRHFLTSSILPRLQLLADPLLACASLDLSKDDPSYRSLAMKYYGQAVRVLRENIAQGKVKGTEGWMLLNVLHLNLFETWNATSRTPGLLHIQGAAQMLKLRGTTHSRSESSDHAFPDDKVFARIAVESFVYHTVNWSIFNGNPIPMPLNELWDFLEPVFAAPPFPAASEAENSPVLGVPWQLYRFLSEATQLARLLPLDTLGLESALTLADRLNVWESTAMPGDDNTAELDPATAVFRYKQRARLSMIALKILIFKFLHPDTGVANRTIQDLLSQGLQIAQLQVAERFHFWPLIIGSAVLRGDQVRIIRSILGDMSKTMRSGTFLRVSRTLEVIWDTVVPENASRSCQNLTPTSSDGLDLLLGRDGRPGLISH